MNKVVGTQLWACDLSVVTFQSSTKTLRHSTLISPFVDNNNPPQLVTYPLTTTYIVKPHQVNNFLIVRWLWNWAGVSEAKLKSCSFVYLWLTLDQLISLWLVSLSLPNKRLSEWTMSPWLVRTRQTKRTVVDSQEVFLTLTRKHSEDSKQSPLSVKCPRLCMEQSCMVMSSVWITLGSQTHVCSRLHPPSLPFASSLHPLMTSWRSKCLYIMSNTKDLRALPENS